MKNKNRNIVLMIGLAIIFFGVFFISNNVGNIGPNKAKILFVGDMMFDRTIRSIAETKGYDFLFSCIGDYLKDFDLVVGNLEGPITFSKSFSAGTKPGEGNNTTFTFSPKIVDVLYKNNIRAVNLGNNHISDFGREGMESTDALLADGKILGFGIPSKNIMATTTIGRSRIALINFNQFIGQNDPSKTITAIWNAKKQNDAVIIFAHWGDEYLPATEIQKATAHRFVDAGADMVIGSHPHVIQEHEIYKGKDIYYSLGNFIFDQYWDETVSHGAGVETYIKTFGIENKEVFFDMSRLGTTCLSK